MVFKLKTRYPNTVIPAAKLARRLNAGGWFVSGGYLTANLPSTQFPVIGAYLIDNILNIETPDHLFKVPAANIVARASWIIEVRHICSLALRLVKPPQGRGYA